MSQGHNFKKPNNLEELEEKLIEALDEEIQKIEEEGLGSSQYRIINGQKIKQEEEFCIYRFITDDIIELPDDLPVEVKISQNIARGHIVTIVGFEVTIAVEKDLGEYVPSATLLSSAKFLLEKIKSCLEDIKKVNPDFNYGIVEKAFGLKNQTLTALKDNYQFHPKCDNPKQKQAISTSLRNEILFVWGPPGTGKTTTQGGMVHSYLNNCDDLKMLILSHTNVATDMAAKTIIDLCNKHQLLIDGKIIRVGNIIEDHKNSVLSDHHISLVKVSKIAEKKTSELVEKRKQLELELEKLKKANEGIQKLIKLQADLSLIMEDLNRSKEFLENKKFVEDEARSGLQTYEYHLKNIEYKIQKAVNKNKFMRFFFGLNLENLESDRASIEDEIKAWKGRLSIIQLEIAKLNEKVLENKRNYYEAHNSLHFFHIDERLINRDALLSNIEDEQNVLVKCFNCDRLLRLKNENRIYRCQKCEYKFEFFPVKNRKSIKWEELESDRENNLSRIEEMKSEVAKLTVRINEINDQIIREARVIITTVTQSYSSNVISSMNFDVVIVDEASMIPLPILYFASGLSSKNIVIIGDFKQLPPISISENKYLNTDIFDYSGIKNNVENNINDERLVSLNEQYRMHPEISEVCNNYIYRPQNELLDSEKVKDLEYHRLLNNEPYGGEPIVFCDTTSANPWCNSNPSGSVFNLYHSIFILKLVEDAINNGVPDDKIGVITPYRDQAKFINRMRHKLLPGSEVKISTVHKFQGLENDIIIFDTAVSFGKKGGPGYFFRKTEQSNRLLNVAVTRPKSKLIVVGNVVRR